MASLAQAPRKQARQQVSQQQDADDERDPEDFAGVLVHRQARCRALPLPLPERKGGEGTDGQAAKGLSVQACLISPNVPGASHPSERLFDALQVLVVARVYFDLVADFDEERDSDDGAVSTVAGLPPPEAVSPFSLPAVSVTSSSTKFGTSTPMIWSL